MNRRGVWLGALLALVALAAGLWWFTRGSGGALAHRGLEPVGSLRIVAWNRPDPPHVGENQMWIALRDPAGAPVRGALLDVVVSMEAMGTMARMESRAHAVEAAPGIYRAGYGLSMPGDWGVVVRVRATHAQAVEARYRLSTRARDLAFDGGRVLDGGVGDSSIASAAADTSLPLGDIQLDAARRQASGIRVAAVGTRELVVPVRAVGRVAFDETRQAEVALAVGGWVRDIAADFNGRAVRRGETLFTLYSPELIAAQQEYVEALHAEMGDSAHAGMAGTRSLAEAARRRLERWGVPTALLDALARGGTPHETVPIPSPIAGVVIDKRVVAGSPVVAGQVLFRIAGVDPVWVEAGVFQDDLGLLRVGNVARLADPGNRGHERRGRIAFIAPSLDPATRTAAVRIEVPNADLVLKPGMFVTVTFQIPLGARLAVPTEAVLPTGGRDLVFVDQGGGRLSPRAVTLGARAGEWVEVRAGLSAGERVVTSGNFLIGAESQLRAAASAWSDSGR